MINYSRFILIVIIIGYLDNCQCSDAAAESPSAPEPDLSTVEPVPQKGTNFKMDAAPGCRAPDIRFTTPKKHDVITEAPFVQFETTQIYLPEDFTTSDIEFVEKIDIDLSGLGSPSGHEEGASSLLNPYEIELEPSIDGEITGSDGLTAQQRNEQLRNKKRRAGGGRRRRIENENGQSMGRGNGGGGGGGRGSRYKRETTNPLRHGTTIEIGKWHQKPIDDDVYYVEISDLYKSKSLAKTLKKNKMHKKKSNKKNPLRSKRSIENSYTNDTTEMLSPYTNRTGTEHVLDEESQNNLQRVKRKSGKTTGALSRPKGGGDSGSKSTSRKGDKGVYEDEVNAPIHPGEEESEEEEEIVDPDEHAHFQEVSEIRFPGEVGPLGDRRLCKIRCVKGKWVGPLCATNEEDEHGNIKFQPLYKSCHVNRIPPHLLLSYRNISVNVGWDLPHGHSLQARCKDLGMYKLLGESRVLCSNGLWAPRMPSCVPTTLLTNFSDDSPPSIKIKLGSGSGAFEPSGLLAVVPLTTIHLDCMYPSKRGTPEWTWTSWYMQYPTGWWPNSEEKTTKYRLTIKNIQTQDSGTFTCASPRGLTNSIQIIVATSECPKLPEPIAPLTLRLEGNKLGERALYRCPLGYKIEGSINSTCLASGNWSSPPPTCHSVQCPPLFLEDSHLSLTELNTSAWGRAVFKCQWGFKLNGPPGLECEPNGAWSGPVPRCRAIQCPAPLVPLNGRIDGTSGTNNHRRYSVGALVTFSCNEGHSLVGEASIVCTETGFWSHSPPFCKSQCQYPGDPPNGLIAPLKFNYDPGDILSVQCRTGYVEFSHSQAAGPPERPTCLPDGNWSGPVPQCRSYEEV